MRRLKGCPDDSASTAWDYAGFPCNLYQGCRPKTLPSFSNLSCQISTQSHLHMVQHDSDWVASFPCSQHTPNPPLKFLNTPLHLPPLLPSLTSITVPQLHSPNSPFKFVNTPPSPPPSVCMKGVTSPLRTPLRVRELGAIIIIPSPPPLLPLLACSRVRGNHHHHTETIIR